MQSFHESANELVEVCLVSSTTQIRIYLRQDVIVEQGEIRLLFYDYRFKDAQGFFIRREYNNPPFLQSGRCISIDLEQLDLSLNYIVELRGTFANVYLDYQLGGILDTYFNPFDEQGFGVAAPFRQVATKV